MMKILFLLLFLSIGLIAGNYEKGLTAYRQHHYKTAKTHFEKSAKSVNASSQYYLGKMYDKGQGISRDRTVALQWYKKAEKNGDNLAKKRMQELRQNTRAKWLDYENGTKIHGIKIILKVSILIDAPSGSGVIYEATLRKGSHKESCFIDENPSNNHTIDKTCEFLNYRIRFNDTEGKTKVTATKW